MHDDVIKTIEEWDQAAERDGYFSSSRLQGFLLDLWGEFPGAEAATGLVERWLTLTTTRELFSAPELREFLAELRAALTPASAVSAPDGGQA